MARQTDRVMLILVLGVAGCAGSQQQPQQQQAQQQRQPEQGQAGGDQQPASAIVDMPPWIARGSGADRLDGVRVIVGVGSVRGIKNMGLAVSSADSAALKAIAKDIETYCASLMHDYAAMTGTGTTAEALAEMAERDQSVRELLGRFTSETMRSAMVVDHWYHPDGTVFALARADVDRAEETVATLFKDYFGERASEAMKTSARRVFDDLEIAAAERRGTTP